MVKQKFDVKQTFPRSRKGELFIKNHSDREGNTFELFEIDSIPQDMKQNINSIWKSTAGIMNENMSPKELSELASECSRYLYRNLPWYGLDSVHQYDISFDPERKKQLQDNFYKVYLRKTSLDKPHKLSDLIKHKLLNCNSHTAILKEFANSNKWGMYSVFLKDKPVNHHTLLRVFGDYMVRIDSSVLPRKEIYLGTEREQTYVIPIKDSVEKNKYLPTTFLHK